MFCPLCLHDVPCMEKAFAVQPLFQPPFKFSTSDKLTCSRSQDADWMACVRFVEMKGYCLLFLTRNTQNSGDGTALSGHRCLQNNSLAERGLLFSITADHPCQQPWFQLGDSLYSSVFTLFVETRLKVGSVAQGQSTCPATIKLQVSSPGQYNLHCTIYKQTDNQQNNLK